MASLSLDLVWRNRLNKQASHTSFELLEKAVKWPRNDEKPKDDTSIS